jgi:16S rRNA (adenine(1408)-N(1))-methyltransferase
METIRGKKSFELERSEFKQRLAGYGEVLLDLGTGDGRFIRRLADQHRDRFFIGVDACRENLRANSQKELPNALFIIAGAQALPHELNGLASHIYINFPWGSLLESLLRENDPLIHALDTIAGPYARMDILLNGEALKTAGWALEAGADLIQQTLIEAGWNKKSHTWMDAQTLRAFPSTWAKRLAFGRDPRAIRLSFQKMKGLS